MREQDIKAAVVASWDSGAGAYDATPRHGIRHDDERVAWRRLVAAILGDPAHAAVPRRRVLDVGTGTGVLALLAAELGHDVTGVDLSAGMLERAARNATAAGLSIQLQVADAESLPDDLRGFDAVVSRHLVWTLPHPAAAIAAWRRAARSDGLVAVIDGTFAPTPRGLGWATALAGRLVRRRDRREGGHHEYAARLYEALPLARQPDTHAIRALLRNAGLVDVRVRTVPEVDRVERAHLDPVERFADRWSRYLATGRVP
jgi:ubiquinone/menaquinone biosynthesis C-methylase UbiE